MGSQWTRGSLFVDSVINVLQLSTVTLPTLLPLEDQPRRGT